MRTSPTDLPPIIVWFRHDLRLADNPALTAVIATGAPVIPLFIWAPHEEAPWSLGGASKWWLHHSLISLRDSLRSLGSDLIIRRGATTEVLLDIVTQSGANTIHWNRRYEPALINQDRDLKIKLKAHNLTVNSFPAALLFEPWTIQNNTGKPFQVFTAFANACMKQPPPSSPLPAPTHLPSPTKWPDSLEIEDLKLESTIPWATGFCTMWRPGEARAHELLQTFLRSAIVAYLQDRDRPDHSGTSRLSPHLHFGEISPRQIWRASQAHPESAPYLRQILWREFAHHLLFHFPQTPQQPLRPDFNRFPWHMNPASLQAWTRGQTGYPLVDAGMRELWHTGWMHNRVRMVAASFLVKHLLIPWQEGAAWFWDTLVDADLANNTLGWQWVAGCGSDAAPYFRIFNPVLQSEKFDPEGAYIRRWIPELKALPNKWIHKPWQTPPAVLTQAGVELGVTYPAPIVSHEEARERALQAFASIKAN